MDISETYTTAVEIVETYINAIIAADKIQNFLEANQTSQK